MPIGSLVAIPELQAEGPARLTAEKGNHSAIKFLATGAEKTQETRQVVRYALLPGTRVTVSTADAAGPGAATILPKGLRRDAATNLLVYAVAYEGGAEGNVREDAITAVAAPPDALEQLALASFHDLRPAHDPRVPAEPWGPPIFCAREELLAWRDASWTGTAGVVALAGARVRPLPHQLITARRVLADRQVRFLLADEVGLGKTIEAGLVMQSLLAMQPRLRVLVVVPGALVSQWFLELYVKFGARPFLMLDGERIGGYAGNPWKDEQFLIVSNRALEELDGHGALRVAQSQWDLLIVDECHRMQPHGVLYKRVATLSKRSAHVLLLSATPARQHADAYLALLSLLQPQVYRIDDHAGFAAKLAAHDKVVELLARTRDAAAGEFASLAEAWKSLLGADPLLAERAGALASGGEPARAALMAHVREHHQLDHRIIRHRRHVLARLSQATGIGGLTMATRMLEAVTYAPDKAETRVLELLAEYRRALMAPYADPTEAPPRLAHWLLQVHLAAAAHPHVLDRLLAMRATVLADPEEFASYRNRAQKGETWAQVLRSDLSENEISTHTAISAACHCDNDAEPAALAALREAVAAWGKAKATARAKALIKRLNAFWEEHPQEKVLVFCSHGLAVGALAEVLEREIGEDAVETFGAHQDTVGREEAARRFRDDARCPLLICDPLGGEGRNFQFVSVVAHHDLPWSIAGVEQRIGRVDRIGRDGDIPSWVLAPEGDDRIDAAWAGLLERAVGVFTGPSSGLEFVTDTLETRALAAALGGGAAAVRALEPELTKLIADERAAADRREEELFQQEASVFAEAARVAQGIEGAQVPVEAVLRWLRGMGGSARRDDEVAHRFHLRARNNEKPEHGTFDRATALKRPELAFFAVGNDLVDRLLDDAAASAWCSAQAWRRKAEGIAAWEGVRATFALTYDLGALLAAKLPLESLRRLFLIAPPTRALICARADGVIESDPKVLAQLTRGFDAKVGDAALSQAASRDAWARPLAQGTVDQITRWQDTVRRAGAAAVKQAETILPQRRDAALAALDAAFVTSLAIARAQAAAAEATLGSEHAEAQRARAEAIEEERQGTALRAALAGARLEIATIAYVVLRP